MSVEIDYASGYVLVVIIFFNRYDLIGLNDVVSELIVMFMGVVIFWAWVVAMGRLRRFGVFPYD